MHYYDGITPSVGRIIDALDRERQVAEAFGCHVESLPEYFFQLGYTSELGAAAHGLFDIPQQRTEPLDQGAVIG